jgi:response regulator of citrate/malate metabolism
MAKQQRKAEDSVRQGAGLAMIRFHSVHGDINAVAEMMNSLNSPGAQAAFADTWLRKASYTLETCWQIVYELCRVILEEEVYLHPEWLRGQSFSSFKEYFEARFDKPFSLWLDLEETYNLLREYKPDVLERIASYAQTRAESQKIHQEALNKIAEDVISDNAKKQGGTHQSRRLDILKAQVKLIEELGREPTGQEIADKVGVARSTVTRHLNAKSIKDTGKVRRNNILKAQAQLRKKLEREPTRQEIANEVGVHRNTVTRYLNGKSRGDPAETPIQETAQKQSADSDTLSELLR